MTSERNGPVIYMRAPEVGFGFIPVIEEGDPMPEQAHYAIAARLDREHAHAEGDFVILDETKGGE